MGGIFGKVPGFADFVNRNLPAAFVDPWADWLETALHRARDAIGERWEASYLAAPVWCFAIDPDVLGEAGWAGVLATSVDSVGRYYPVTVAFPLSPGTPASLAAEAHQSRLRHAEELALSLVDGSRVPDEVLPVVGPWGGRPDGDRNGAEALVYRNRFGSELATVLVHPEYPPVSELKAPSRPAAPTGVRVTSTKAGYWWHYGWPGRGPEAVRTRGLPDPDVFAGFIDGAWRDHGFEP